MYNKITNPKTNRMCSIFSKKGQYILKKYIEQIGGTTTDSENYTVAKISENGTKQKKNWILISVKQILYDSGMRKKIKEICNDKGKGTKGLKGGFSLHKWETVWKEISENIPLDPIIVKKYKNTDYYEVINGRHRATASLCAGLNYVPAFIQK